MRLYIAVTPDKYELPVCVTDTAWEMAKWHGVPPAVIHQAVYRQKRVPGGRKRHTHPRGTYRFYAVDVDDDE